MSERLIEFCRVMRLDPVTHRALAEYVMWMEDRIKKLETKVSQ